MLVVLCTWNLKRSRIVATTPVPFSLDVTNSTTSVTEPHQFTKECVLVAGKGLQEKPVTSRVKEFFPHVVGRKPTNQTT